MEPLGYGTSVTAGWSSPVARWAHNPKVAGSNPAPATMHDEGLADVAAANPFRLPRLHPGIGCAAGDAASRTAAQKPSVWKHLRTSNVVEPPFATARTTCRSCAHIVLARRVQLIGGG